MNKGHNVDVVCVSWIKRDKAFNAVDVDFDAALIAIYVFCILSISVEIGGVLWSVPLDPANTDYINIMALVQEGKLTIAPAS